VPCVKIAWYSLNSKNENYFEIHLETLKDKLAKFGKMAISKKYLLLKISIFWA